MPVTAGHVPGLTSRLRRIPMDPGRFHSGRWLLLAEGVLVSAFGIAGLVAAALHPHAGPTGASVLGLATTPGQSAILLAFGVVAIAAVGNRRAAITVTALSAVAYFMLLFVSSVATAYANPTPLGFHAADILLHGVLAAVNLALLMWLIPDELGDEVWAPRRRRKRDRRQHSALEVAREPGVTSTTVGPEAKPPSPEGTARAPDIRAHPSSSEPPLSRSQPNQPGSSNPPVGGGAEHRGLVEQSSGHQGHELLARNGDGSARGKRLAARLTDAVSAYGGVVAVAVLVATVGIIIWRRRRSFRP